jgi:hypothetical protein
MSLTRAAKGGKIYIFVPANINFGPKSYISAFVMSDMHDMTRMI